MSKKLLIGAGVVVIALAAAEPYVAGNIAGTHIFGNTDSLNRYLHKQSAPAKVTQQQYTRGWSHSQAVDRVVLTDPETGKELMCVDLKTEVNHGLSALLRGHWFEGETRFVMTADKDAPCGLQTVFKDDPKAAARLASMLGTQSPMTIQTLAPVFGGLVVNASTQSYPVQASDSKSDWEIAPVQAAIHVAAGGNHYDYRIQWGGVHAPKGDDQGLMKSSLIGIGGVELHGEQKRWKGSLWTGTMAADIHDVDYRLNARGQMLDARYNSIRFNSDSAIQDNKLSTQFQLQGGDLMVNGVSFGQFNAVLGADGIQADKVEQFSQDVTDLSEKNTWKKNASPAEKFRAIPPKTLGVLLSAVAPATLTLKELSYSLGGAKAQVGGNAAWPGLEQLDPKALQDNPTLAVDKLQAQAKGVIPVALINAFGDTSAHMATVVGGAPADQVNAIATRTRQALRQQFDDWVVNGFLTKDTGSGDYGFSLRLDKGHLTLNGHDLPST